MIGRRRISQEGASSPGMCAATELTAIIRSRESSQRICPESLSVMRIVDVNFGCPQTASVNILKSLSNYLLASTTARPNRLCGQHWKALTCNRLLSGKRCLLSTRTLIDADHFSRVFFRFCCLLNCYFFWMISQSARFCHQSVSS